ncbi:hypothetical protein [Alkalibacillus haloalkaliphilus]|uniref:Uncharacterized protein n=1 Tax=Alkalibacillus haloalkaliphilus TaxID=94136 RepID=A0A511W3L5_9BACI|nr:hypothetical protein [Alkalibacillus haloalkaliphilus]GEN45351.1 hypothetical protein AHA02nite_11270 [Alkalibacillus haloalkaliphilus]
MKDFIHRYEYLEKKKELYGKEKVYVKSTNVEPRHLYQYGDLKVVIRDFDYLTEDEIKQAFDYEEKRLYPERFIPQGTNCYDENGTCPFWDINFNEDADANGYCHYLTQGDWEEEADSILYKKCKACDINTEQPEPKETATLFELYVNGEVYGSGDTNEVHQLFKQFIEREDVEDEVDLKLVKKEEK